MHYFENQQTFSQTLQLLKQFTAPTTANNHFNNFIPASYKNELRPRWLISILVVRLPQKQKQFFLSIELIFKAPTLDPSQLWRHSWKNTNNLTVMQ